MGRPLLWTEEEDQEIRHLSERGCSTADAAEIMGKPIGAVKGRARRIGVKFSAATGVHGPSKSQRDYDAEVYRIPERANTKFLKLLAIHHALGR